MKLNNKAEVFAPSLTQKNTDAVNELCVAAHEDDVEFMAAYGIIKSFNNPSSAFNAVITTNGAGSSRCGIYESYSDEDMIKIRAAEQKKAALIGDYANLYLLNYTSAQVKDSANEDVENDFLGILTTLKPQVVYTHNPMDKHDTHCGVTLKLLDAIRKMPKADRPKKLYGCEVWRSLDWVCDNQKVKFDLSGHENLTSALMGVFDSQIAGGKRYDLAVQGRYRANATFLESHDVDNSDAMSYAMDLSPLLEDDSLSLKEYAFRFLEDFKSDQSIRLDKLSK